MKRLFKGKKNSFRNKTPSIQYVSSEEAFKHLIYPDAYMSLDKHPDVLIAVDKIADMVSNMSIHLMQNTPKGDIRLKNALSRKIDVEPCRNMTRKTWIYKIVYDLLLTGDGNSLVHISYDYETDLIKDLTPLPMTHIQFETTKDDYFVKYENYKYPSGELIHFVLKPDPVNYWKGTGYRVHLKDIVSNLSQATKTKKEFFQNKNMPSLIVKVDALTEDFETEEGRSGISKKYLETSKANEPWIIPADLLDVQQVKPLTLKDIAINESVEIDKKTVAGLLGVPAFFLGVGTYNENEYRNFINTKVMSIAQIIAQTLTRDVLYSPDLYFKFNPRSLYSYNLNELVSAGSRLIQLNTMRRNELRDWLGMEPDEEMEDLIVLENYIPVDKLGDQNKLKGGEA